MLSPEYVYQPVPSVSYLASCVIDIYCHIHSLSSLLHLIISYIILPHHSAVLLIPFLSTCPYSTL